MGIKMMPDQFPDHRREDPKRGAEARVFDALQDLELNGHGLYEFRYRKEGQQVDYALWVHDLARFAVQVKGGQYDMDSTGQWSLRMLEGAPQKVQSLLEETEDGCMEMRDGVQRATDYLNFVVGILIFTDMPRNEQMEHAARERHHVHIVWGLDTLAEDLQRIAGEVGIKRPPRPRIAENEWGKANELQFSVPAGPRLDQRQTQDTAAGKAEPEDAERLLSLGSATINIQHVETLVIQHVPQDRGTDGTPAVPGA